MLPASIEKTLSRLLGRKSKTSTNIADEIKAQEACIDACRAKIEAAKSARMVAIEEFDAVGHKAADEDVAEADREIERRAHAIETLKAAHEWRVAFEAREAFRKEVDALEEEAASLRKRIPAEYAPAAAAVAKVVADLAGFQKRKKALAARAKELREVFTCSDPEDFRGAPLQKQWSASWPAPEGYTIGGPVEDAPRGSIVWKDGEPVATRPGVEITHFRIVGGGQPASFVESVGDLPKLIVGEGFFHVGYKAVVPEFVPPVRFARIGGHE